MSELTVSTELLPEALVDSVERIKSFLIDAEEGLADMAQLPEGEENEEFLEHILMLWTKVYRDFEKHAARLSPHLLSEGKNYVRQRLHPHLLRAPFVNRAYLKPRGYAGDYEMMNMLLKPEPMGNTVYEQVVHLLNVLPGIPESVRNRSDIMKDYLSVYHSDYAKEPVFRILSVASGPAWEVERFLKTKPERRIQITLVDHDEEALAYAGDRLNRVAAESGLEVEVVLIRESVIKLLKDARNQEFFFEEAHFHVAYSAGIMDYLSDNICTELIHYLLRSLHRHGVFFTTNMHPQNTERYWMEYIFDWSLIYRDEEALRALSPVPANRVYADATGINVFLEVKPQ